MIHAAVNEFVKQSSICAHIICNSIKVCEQPVPRTNKMPQCAFKFEAVEENRILNLRKFALVQNNNLNDNKI